MLDTRLPTTADTPGPTVAAFARVTLDTLRANRISDHDIRTRFLPDHAHADGWFEQMQINRCGFVQFPAKEVKAAIAALLEEEGHAL